MINDILKNTIQDICYIGVTTIAGIATYYGKKSIGSKQELIGKQKEALKQQLGDAQYNKDVDTAKRIIMAVEQMGKEYNWEGAIKHSKVVEKITTQTGLSAGDIFDIIKATVSEIGKDKKTSPTQTVQ
ncbi:hypothetical protein ACJDU8_14270 [Clostridium sp. WILCCON 0269]|uniref:Phage holin n=1 Tax=Candidatus Clostridium eludens TaxID=3381663 RepID=A0ABW8SM14_9CLOT